jgi:hypothetical protein
MRNFDKINTILGLIVKVGCLCFLLGWWFDIGPLAGTNTKTLIAMIVVASVL